MVYVGIDVHRKRSQVAIVDEDSNEILNRNVSNEPGELMPILGRLDKGTPVVFEAAYGWGWLADLLDDLGLEAHLAHPLATKAIASARLKDDKVDARTLANLLRADLVAEGWIAPADVRQLRMLLRHRVALVRVRTAAKARIHAVLADRGLRPDVGLWSTEGCRWLDDLELPDAARTVCADNRAVIDFVSARIATIEKALRAEAKEDPRVKALRTLPGIGYLTALIVVAEIGDISRFESARKLCAWAGLTPRVRNSDTKVRHGHITKQGSVWVRWSLVEAAHVAAKRPPFATVHARIAARRGRKIATVAVARKLLARCHHVLKEIES